MVSAVGLFLKAPSPRPRGRHQEEDVVSKVAAYRIGRPRDGDCELLAACCMGRPRDGDYELFWGQVADVTED
jgi:hypothetical protein